MHIAYCCQGADEAGEHRHAQAYMRENGITYQASTPQSLFDQWWFWNCESLPQELPPFLREVNVADPMKYVGYGISEEQAIAISSYSKK